MGPFDFAPFDSLSSLMVNRTGPSTGSIRFTKLAHGKQDRPFDRQTNSSYH